MPGQPEPDEPALLSEWMRYEGRYRTDSYRGIGARDELLVATGGTGVLVTASHSVAQVRHGKRKKPDLRTGGLAELVAVHAGATALTALGSGGGDPNWDTEHPFKCALKDLAPHHRTVLDLHGMDDGHGIDLCIGSGSPGAGSTHVITSCRASAERAGLRVSVDRPFSASRPSTITSTAQALGCAAAQLEIAAHRRDPVRSRADSLELARWLIELVRGLGS